LVYENVGMIIANKAYFSDITVKNIYHSFTRKMAAKASWHRNYVTVTLYIVYNISHERVVNLLQRSFKTTF